MTLPNHDHCPSKHPSSTQSTSKPCEDIKPCCACPDTKDLRDKCVFLYGPDAVECKEFIEKHNECLRSYGFKIE